MTSANPRNILWHGWCLTPENIMDAREWVADCEWAELEDDDMEDLTDREIVSGIARHYDGGWAAFLESY